MKHLKAQLYFTLTIIGSTIAGFSLNAQKDSGMPAYNIYAGSTHAHTAKENIGFSKKFIEESEAIGSALKKVSEKLIAEEKKNNGYLIVSDKQGNIKKIAAKDL